ASGSGSASGPGSSAGSGPGFGSRPGSGFASGPGAGAGSGPGPAGGSASSNSLAAGSAQAAVRPSAYATLGELVLARRAKGDGGEGEGDAAFTEAEHAFQCALDPSARSDVQARARIGLGRLRLAARDVMGAHEMALRALGADPRHAGALALLADCHEAA